MTEPARKPSATAKNKAARLMAVQALYQIGFNREAPALVVHEYLGLRKNMDVEGETMIEPDEALFREIVLGAIDRRSDIADLIKANYTRKEDSQQSTEPLLEAIFASGAYELLERREIPSSLIIASYIEVTKAFFAGKESGLVNAVLDSIAKAVRL